MQQQHAAQNQLVAAILQNPVLAQQLALHPVARYGQQQISQNPYGPNWNTPQIGRQNTYRLSGIQAAFSQPGFQLAPLSWVGQAGSPQFGGR